MVKSSIILVFVALHISLVSFAQQAWTLQRCIDYAIEHNIDLKQRQVQIELGQVKLDASKNSWLPMVNADLGQDFSFGNVVASAGTMSTGETTNTTVAYTSAKIFTAMPLFEGFRIPNQIKSDRFSLQAATAELDKARKDVRIQVGTYYLQVLYYQGMAEVSRKQVAVSEGLVARARSMVNEGRRPERDLADALAQLASDQYVLSQDEGNVILSTLNLCYLLGLESMDDFVVADSAISDTQVQNTSLPLAQKFYDNIVEEYPSILAAKANIESARADIKVARSYLYPSVSLQGSIQSYYYTFLANSMPAGSPFFKSLDKNRSELIGIHVSIPIFNRFETRSKIRKTQFLAISRSLNLDDARLKLRKEIQEAYYNAQTAATCNESAIKAEKAGFISFDYEQKSYDAGRSTIFELLQANQKYVKAQQNMVQSKYEYLIRQKILEFYTEDKIVVVN